MRVLVVQHLDGEGLGQVGTALTEAGIDIDIRLTNRGDTLPETCLGHDGLIVLGGTQNALDDEGSPHFPPLLPLMREFVEADRAVLGICLGSQLLARAFGGENLVGCAPEFAWRQVELTGEGRVDPVLGALPVRFPIFEWHDDTFTLPDNAVHLARNDAAENQAFRLGRAAYGIQFHFEADRKVVAEWNRAFADELAETHPDWPDRHEREAERHGPEADAAGLAIARAWVSTI